jgi:hypothetical protein
MAGPRYETVEVPFQIIDGKRVLSRHQIEEAPYLLDFIKRFPTCFELHPTLDAYVFKEPDDGKSPVAK